MAGRSSKPDPEADIYVATASGVVKLKGQVYRYIAGRTKVRAGHPLLRAMPDRFAPLTVDYETVNRGPAAIAPAAPVMET